MISPAGLALGRNEAAGTPRRAVPAGMGPAMLGPSHRRRSDPTWPSITKSDTSDCGSRNRAPNGCARTPPPTSGTSSPRGGGRPIAGSAPTTSPSRSSARASTHGSGGCPRSSRPRPGRPGKTGEVGSEAVASVVRAVPEGGPAVPEGVRAVRAARLPGGRDLSGRSGAVDGVANAVPCRPVGVATDEPFDEPHARLLHHSP